MTTHELIELLKSGRTIEQVPVCYLVKLLKETKDGDLRFLIKKALFYASLRRLRWQK